MDTAIIGQIETLIAAAKAAAAAKAKAEAAIETKHINALRDAIKTSGGSTPAVRNRVTVECYPSDSLTTRRAIAEFNALPEVNTHRTHGRTTITERLQMAYFSKFIVASVVADKFAVSPATVYLYTRKYGVL